MYVNYLPLNSKPFQNILKQEPFFVSGESVGSLAVLLSWTGWTDLSWTYLCLCCQLMGQLGAEWFRMPSVETACLSSTWPLAL